MSENPYAPPQQTEIAEDVILAEGVPARPVRLGVFVLAIVIVDLALRVHQLFMVPFALVTFTRLPASHPLRDTPISAVAVDVVVALIAICADTLILLKRRRGIVLGWVNVTATVLCTPAAIFQTCLRIQTAPIPIEIRPLVFVVGLCAALVVRLTLVVLYAVALVIASKRLALLRRSAPEREPPIAAHYLR